MSETTSPITGWTRATWADFADRLLLAARPYGSQHHARITLPGPEGGYGRDVDGLEGFARTFLAAGFRLAGEAGRDPLNLADWYARGIAAGTDPRSPERWVRPDEHPQAKVEAASIALILDMTRPWIWNRLDEQVQEQVIDYLSPAVGDTTYPRINWVWFRLVVQTFLRSVGGPYSRAEMAEDLATHDTFRRADGWMADGPERAYDHYVGWALHLYPTLWARMAGAEDLAAERRLSDRAMLDRFLTDAIHLVGADGAPLIEGRSLIYRFAAAAPFWVGAIAGVTSVPLGQLRRAASGIMQHFTRHGVPGPDGLLTTGWYDTWQPLAQAYSGTGSPYWASKGLLGLALPADHPAWTSTEAPLPVETSDGLRSVRAPGWIVSATRADGLVRVINHGTDHARPGDMVGDSALYARLGYSTATSPFLDDASWRDPLDESVVLLDSTNRATHRAGMDLVTLEVMACGKARLGVGASRVHAHWLTPDRGQQSHGSGAVGQAEPAGELTVVSLVRGPHELRLIRVESLTRDPGTLRLRTGGWPITAPVDQQQSDGAAVTRGGGLVSAVRAVLGSAAAGIEERRDVSPLGPVSVVPWLTRRPQPGVWTADLVTLAGADAFIPGGPCSAAVHPLVDGISASVTWPDGVSTTSDIHLDRARDGRPDPR